MAFPQPSADESCIQGKDFFRLNTPLTSPGDIYESQQSCRGFALGPDSDIANVRITYFDPQAGLENPGGVSNVNTFTLSPDRSFIGRLDAFSTTPQGDSGTKYPQSNKAARVLISSLDIYDPNYRPTASVPADDHFDIQAPILDVIQYFGDPPSLIPQRSDKIYRWRFYDTIGGSQWIVVPFYGRKYACLQIMNWNSIEPNSITVFGAKLTLTVDSQKHIETSLLSSTTINVDGGTATLIVRAANQGMFDLLSIGIGTTEPGSVGPAPMYLRVSDDAL